MELGFERQKRLSAKLGLEVIGRADSPPKG